MKVALKEKPQIAFLLVVLVSQIVVFFLPPDISASAMTAGLLLLFSSLVGWAQIRILYDPEAVLEETIISRDRRRWFKRSTEEAKRADGERSFELNRILNPVFFAAVLIAFLVFAAITLSEKIGSGWFQTVTLPAVSGIAVFALMIMTVIYFKFVLKEKAFAQAHVIKTGLIIQNMLAAILLFVK